MKLNRTTFMDLSSNYEDAEIVLFSIPYDSTASYRPGSRFAGDEIRTNSLIGFETFSPYLNKDIREKKVFDIGSVEVPLGAPEPVLDIVYNLTKKITTDRKIPFMIGGEHSLTHATIKALHEKYPDLKLIQLDAHTDLRNEYLGSKCSHASVMMRCYNILGKKNIYQHGIRSGLKSEFTFAQENNHIYLYDLKNIPQTVEQLKDKPVYITIDLDILDPSAMPGTGTPEPGGVTFKELNQAIWKMSQLNQIVGVDVVELAPHIDPTGISTAAAIKVIREMITAIK